MCQSAKTIFALYFFSFLCSIHFRPISFWGMNWNTAHIWKCRIHQIRDSLSQTQVLPPQWLSRMKSNCRGQLKLWAAHYRSVCKDDVEQYVLQMGSRLLWDITRVVLYVTWRQGWLLSGFHSDLSVAHERYICELSSFDYTSVTAVWWQLVSNGIGGTEENYSFASLGERCVLR